MTISTPPHLVADVVSAAATHMSLKRQRPSTKAKYDRDLVLMLTASQGFLATELLMLRLCSQHLLYELSPLVPNFHVATSFKSNFSDSLVLAATNRFSGIRALNLNDCPHVSSFSVSAIARLPLLRLLSLNGCGAVDNISFLATSASLEELHLSDTRVHDVSCLSSCDNLEVLRLDGSMVRSCSLKALEFCPKLQVLGLDDTSFDDASVLDGFLSLRELYMNRTKIRVLGALGNCSLEILELADTKVRVPLSCLSVCLPIFSIFLFGLHQYQELSILIF